MRDTWDREGRGSLAQNRCRRTVSGGEAGLCQDAHRAGRMSAPPYDPEMIIHPRHLGICGHEDSCWNSIPLVEPLWAEIEREL